MTRGERMSPVDTTWLRMDRPNNPMVIVGVIKLTGPVDPSELAALLAERLLAYRRFRQKAVPRAGGMWWVDDDHFEIGRHIHHVRLPGAGGDAELEQFVGELADELLQLGVAAGPRQADVMDVAADLEVVVVDPPHAAGARHRLLAEAAIGEETLGQQRGEFARIDRSGELDHADDDHRIVRSIHAQPRGIDRRHAFAARHVHSLSASRAPSYRRVPRAVLSRASSSPRCEKGRVRL